MQQAPQEENLEFPYAEELPGLWQRIMVATIAPRDRFKWTHLRKTAERFEDWVAELKSGNIDELFGSKWPKLRHDDPDTLRQNVFAWVSEAMGHHTSVHLKKALLRKEEIPFQQQVEIIAKRIIDDLVTTYKKDGDDQVIQVNETIDGAINTRTRSTDILGDPLMTKVYKQIAAQPFLEFRTIEDFMREEQRVKALQMNTD